MNKKGKSFLLISLSGLMVFTFAIFGKNLSDSITAKAAGTGGVITDNLVFEGKSERIAGTNRYACKGKTPSGQELYLISDYTTGNNPNNHLMYLQDMSANKYVDFYISEFEDGKDDNGVDSIFKFQGINSITFDNDSTIKGYYWNERTQEDIFGTGRDLSIPANGTLSLSPTGKVMKFQVRGNLAAVTINTISFNYTCNPSGPAEEVEELQLSGNYKTTYYVNDTVDHSGLVVTAIYTSGIRVDVTDDVVFNDPDMSTAGNKNVGITFGGCSTSYQITVSERATVVGLRLVNTRVAENINFFVGDEFSFRGIVVYATYSTGSTEYDVTSQATASGYDMTRSGTYYLDVSFEGFTRNDAYYIIVDQIQSLSYTASSSAKTEYEVGESFDKTGFSIFAHMKVAAEAIDVTSEATFDAPSFTTEGNYNVVVSYKEATVNIPVTVVRKYGITIVSDGHGVIDGIQSSYKAGDLVEFTAIPNSGYEVDKILKDNVEILPDSTGKYSFTMPNSRVTIDASFKEQSTPVCPYVGTYTSGLYEIVIEDATHGFERYDDNIVHFLIEDASSSGLTFIKNMQPGDKDNSLDGNSYYIFWGGTSKTATFGTNYSNISFKNSIYTRTFTKQ